ncbi:hypothetical protein MMC32_002776 [Xylographa parallela]|nr:hypothetical protein [Xylographa parallela]
MPRHSSRSEYVEESRERDYYPASTVGGRGNRVTEYEEIDIRERRGGREREPDFLRDDYARSSAGPLVVRERDEEIIEEKGGKGGRRRHGGGREVVEEEIIVQRGGGGREREREREREPPRERDVVKEEEVIIRKGGRERREPVQHEEIREEFIYKPRERSPPILAREKEEWVFAPRRRAKSYEREERREEREPPRTYEKEEIIIRRDEREEERPRNRGYERDELIIRRDERSKSRERPRPRELSYDREEVIIRRDEREGGRERGYREDDFISIRRGEAERPRPKRESSFEREEVIIRRGDAERPRPKREPSFEREEVIIRRDERERPRERPRSRERDFREEDITIRRDERGGGRETEQIIIRRGERERESEPSEPEPEPMPIPIPIPEPMPIRAPPIHQEIITHHRHIDHGFENRAPMPAPLPPPTIRREPSRSPSPKSTYDEIEIRRRGEHNGRRYDDDIVIDTRRKVSNERPYENRTPRRRSPSMETRSRYDPIAEEEDFYARKTAERAYIGEAYNGATKDWAIVDVPPGTNRVKMNGIGGASQEVTWQRYNGVRRSKFLADDDGGGYGSQMEERTPERGLDKGRRFVAMKPKTEAMWTEITKDLVIREAIEGMGYDFEETEFFYYVMEYLRYEDVLRLVELSEDLRRERRERIRAIEWERAHEPEPEPERPRRQLAAEPWDEERIFEREVIYDRPPPPPMPPVRREVREKVYVMR